MRITRTLRDQCGASVTCDKIHDTDDPDDLVVQGRHVDPDSSMIWKCRTGKACSR